MGEDPGRKRGARPSPRGFRGALSDVPGFRTAAVHCGLKTAPSHPSDLALLYSECEASAAGAFTTNMACAAPVRVSRRHLVATGGAARAVIVNAGCANACTGERGLADAIATCRAVAERLSIPASKVLVASTGVIGKNMPMDRILSGIDVLACEISAGRNAGDFSKAIMTTDLVPKCAAASFPAGPGGKRARISGACKGSGMIAPRMATMLAFLATDVAVSPRVLQRALRETVEETFNAVTVDGDTSTHDSVFVLANGRAGNRPILRPRGPLYEAFRGALFATCSSLAQQIAADGEGAGKMIAVAVAGARSKEDAKKIARAIAESPLVKTAMAGCDPNWGRILAAAGRSGARFDEREVSVQIGDHDVFRDGAPAPFDKKVLKRVLSARKVTVLFMAGRGPGAHCMYTCDLTHGYITINAEYHT